MRDKSGAEWVLCPVVATDEMADKGKADEYWSHMPRAHAASVYANCISVAPSFEPGDDVVEKAGDAVVKELNSRKGFRHLIDDIDDDLLAEIRDALGSAALAALLEK